MGRGFESFRPCQKVQVERLGLLFFLEKMAEEEMDSHPSGSPTARKYSCHSSASQVFAASGSLFSSGASPKTFINCLSPRLPSAPAKSLGRFRSDRKKTRKAEISIDFSAFFAPNYFRISIDPFLIFLRVEGFELPKGLKYSQSYGIIKQRKAVVANGNKTHIRY